MEGYTCEQSKWSLVTTQPEAANSMEHLAAAYLGRLWSYASVGASMLRSADQGGQGLDFASGRKWDTVDSSIQGKPA